MRLVSKIYHFVVDPKIPTLSGALCFFLLLNGGSYLFLFVSISSFFFIDYTQYINSLSDGIVKDIILYLLQYNSNLSISIFLLISSIYSSSSLYYHFMHICEVITKQAIDYKISKRVQALIFVPIALLIGVFFILVISFLQYFYRIISTIFFMLYLFIVIYLLNKIALRNYNFYNLYKGILFSFLYIVVFSILFGVYLKLFSNFKLVYGVLSTIIISLFYLYVCIIGFFLGLYINCKNLDVSNFLLSKE